MSIADRREVRNERFLDVRQLKQRESPLQMGACGQPLKRKWTAQSLAQSKEVRTQQPRRPQTQCVNYSLKIQQGVFVEISLCYIELPPCSDSKCLATYHYSIAHPKGELKSLEQKKSPALPIKGS